MAISLTQAVKNLFLANTPQTLSVVATPLTGSAITITEADVVQGSFSIDRSCVAGNQVEIGNVSSAELTFALNNVDGQFNDFTFEGATLQVTVSVDGNACPLGYFVVDEVKKYKTTINIVALDKMVAFDQEIDQTKFGANLTPSAVIGVCCTQCGITLGDVSGMINKTVTINISILNDVCSYRDIIRWVAEITATNAFIDEQGRLCMKWYTNASQTINESNRTTHDMQGYAVSITGVEIIDGDTNYFSGSKGYVIKIENNPLIVEKGVATRLTNIANRLTALSYQPYTVETLPMAWLMPLDMIDFVKDGTTYRTIVTNTQFWLNQNTKLEGKGESPLAKGYAQKALTNSQANSMKALENRVDLAIQEAVQPVRNYFWHDAEGSHVSTQPQSTSGQNTLVTSSAFQARTGSVVDASFGSTATIGHTGTGEHNVYVSNNGMYVRKGTDLYAVFGLNNGEPYTRLGNVGEGQKNVVITDGSIALKNGSETRILLAVNGSTPYVKVGQSGEGQKNVTILDSSVNLRNGQDVHLQLGTDTTSTYVRVGQTGATDNNIIIRPNGVYQRTGATANASFLYDDTNSTPQITLGRKGSSQRNVYITNNTIDFREGTNVRMRMAIDGNTPFVRIGNTGTSDKNVIITDGSINLRTGTTSEFAVGTDTTSAVVRIGQSDGMRAVIRPTQMSIGKVETGKRNMLVTDSALSFRTGTIVDASFGYENDAPVITLGRTGSTQRNVYVTSESINVRKGTTNLATFGDDITLVNPNPNGTKVVIGTEASFFGNSSGTGVTIETPPLVSGWVITKESITIAQGATDYLGFNDLPSLDAKFAYALGGTTYYIPLGLWLGYTATDSNGVKITVVKPLPNSPSLALEIKNNANGSITTGNFYGTNVNGGSVKIGTATISNVGQHSFSCGEDNAIEKQNGVTLGIGLQTKIVGQVAVGRYNAEGQRVEPLFVIGNGISNSKRANALTVSPYGDVEASGEITDGNGNTLSAIYRGRLSANTDLNDVLTIGRYHFATTDNVTNTPTGVTWGLLEVLRNGNAGGIVMQRITVNNRIYLRQTINMGSEWSEWYAFSPDAIHNTWTAYTAEYLGLTITLKVNNAMPTLVRLKINGTTTGALATASGYVTLATFSDVSMPASVLGYSVLGALGYGQIRVSGGKVEIGYTRKFSDGTVEDIPTGRGIWVDQTIVLA